MTPEQLLQIGAALGELPLHAILLVAVIVLWLELRKTRQALDDCLAGNLRNAQRIGFIEQEVERYYGGHEE